MKIEKQAPDILQKVMQGTMTYDGFMVLNFIKTSAYKMMKHNGIFKMQWE